MITHVQILSRRNCRNDLRRSSWISAYLLSLDRKEGGPLSHDHTHCMLYTEVLESSMSRVDDTVAGKKTPRFSNEEWDNAHTASEAAFASDPAASHAPSVTVFTNMTGAVSVAVDRERTSESGRRLSLKALPENLFNPFRNCRSKRRQLVTPRANQTAPSDAPTAEVPAENVHVTSAAAAAIAVQGIKKGVSDAMDRWALQT